MSVHDETWDRSQCEYCGNTISFGSRTNHAASRFNKFIGKKVVLNVKLDKMPPFWFTTIVRDAVELLEEGVEYTVKNVNPASSWCAVVLEEKPAKEFNLGWFDIVGEPKPNLIGSLEW
jgi:hypothetical protein